MNKQTAAWFGHWLRGLAVLSILLCLGLPPHIRAQRAPQHHIIVTRDDEKLPLSDAGGARQFATPTQTQNQWRPAAALEGGTVFALLSAGGRIYAGTSLRGIFVSTDNGRSWRASSNGLGNITVIALLAAGGNLLAATTAGIFRSSDGGDNWTNAGVTFGTNALTASGASLFAGGAGGRIFRSTDNGQSWSARTVVANGTVTALAVQGNDLFAGVSGTANGLFRSGDQGQSWTPLTTGLPNNGVPAVLALALNAGTLYAGLAFYTTNQSQVYSSTDNGATWQQAGSRSIAFNLGTNTTLLAAVQGLAFDGGTPLALSSGIATLIGADWTEFLSNRGLPVALTVYTLLRVGQTTLLGTNGGLYALSPDGQAWGPSQSGLTAATVTALAVNNNALIASAGDSGLYRSTDNGQSWTPAQVINVTGRRVSVVRLAVRGNEFVAGTRFGGVFRSNDDGATWTPINNSGWRIAAAVSVNDLAVGGNDVYALAFTAVHKLAADNSGWTALHGGGALVPAPVRLAASGANLYVGATTALLRSTDGGANFNPVNLGVTQTAAGATATRGDNVYYSYTANNTGNVSISTDNGASFRPGLSALFINNFAFSGNVLYGATGQGVFYSVNNGVNWSPVNAGLSTRLVNAVAARGEMIFAGTSGFGVFAATNPQLQPANLANASAASFSTSTLAPESIVAAFGTALSTTTLAAETAPLPTTLGGTRVIVRDSTGVERNAPLFFVAPGQVNYQLPPNTAAGRATVFILNGTNESSFGEVVIANVAPGLFAANANGQGVAAGVVLRLRADGTQAFEPLAQFDSAANRFSAVPINLGPEGEQVFLVLFGTGFRLRANLAGVTATIGGAGAEVSFAAAAPDLIGADQLNLRLPRSLAGRGEVEVALTVEGQAANRVSVNVR